MALARPAINSSPSPWIVRWATLLPREGLVLDLASGNGRHARWLAARGHTVLAVDRDADALEALQREAPRGRVRCMQCDLEAGGWPLAQQQFDAIVVTNYLHRPLFDSMVAALRPGAVLLYETFARGNERYGKPSNPDFLLEPGELIARVAGRLRVIAYEDVYVDLPKPALTQRICAINALEVPQIASAAAI